VVEDNASTTLEDTTFEHQVEYLGGSSDEVSSLLASIRKNKPSLLEESVFNLGILFEVPDDDFHAADRGHLLTKLGHFSSRHWEKMKNLRFIFPSEAQTYHAKTAAIPLMASTTPRQKLPTRHRPKYFPTPPT
jgi:hypothetical protein